MCLYYSKSTKKRPSPSFFFSGSKPVQYLRSCFRPSQRFYDIINFARAVFLFMSLQINSPFITLFSERGSSQPVKLGYIGQHQKCRIGRIKSHCYRLV